MPSRQPLVITGNLTADPEPFAFGEAKGVRLTIAENIGYSRTTATGTEFVDEEPAFWPVTIWGTHGRVAANVAASLHKGDRVTVIGRYRNNVWEAEDGTKRSRLEVQADEVAVSLRHAEVAITRNATGTRAAEPLPAGL